MHVTVLAYGSRGDVQPFVALGVGLQRAGFTVRIAAPETFETFVTGYGLQFAPLAGDPTALARDLVDRAGNNPVGIVRALWEYALPLAVEVLAGVERACQGTDVIIHSFLLAIPGHSIARQRGIPDVFAQMYPMFTPTRALPNLMFPDLPLGPDYNHLTHVLQEQAFWQSSRASYQWLRRSAPQLPADLIWPFADGYAHRPPVLYGYSPHVIPRPSDWRDDIHVTGYWFLDGQEDWQPSPELLAFLEDGPPPIYIGFGSMISDDMAEVLGIVGEALRRSRQRAVFVTGWGGDVGASLPDDVFVLDGAPHDWLFPRMAAVVHHGGVGTTAEGLRAGVPSIVVPFTADQPFWGRQVCKLGVGPEPIPRTRLTAEKLAYAIRTAVQHRPMRQRAAALGEKMRLEDGVSNAVAVIQRIVEQSKR